VHNLTNAWLNASPEQRQEVEDQILSRKSIDREIADIQPHKLKDRYQRKDFFICDIKSDIYITEMEIEYEVDKSRRL
jgi:hypothetical protein